MTDLFTNTPADLLTIQSALQMNRLLMPANTVALFGDSRLDYNYASATVFGAAGFIAQANARMGHRMKLSYKGTTPGARSDQYIATWLTGLLASPSAYVIVWGAYNDINQGVTADQIWLGAAAGGTGIGMKAALDQIVAAGMQPILISEPGATAFTATQIAQVLSYNQRLREYAENNRWARYFNMGRIAWDGSTTGASIVFKTGYSTDGIHPLVLWAAAAGAAFASQFGSLFTPIDGGVSAAFEKTTLNTYGNNFLTNGLFTTTTGGTAGTGITGTAPSSVTVSRTGSATATISTAANADGYGNDLIVNATFTAAGENIQIAFFPGTSPWAAGDLWDAGVSVAVDAGGEALAGPVLRPIFQSTTQGIAGDLYQTGGAKGPNTAYSLDLQSPTGTVQAGTLSSISWYLFLYGGAAGSATAKISKAWLRKRFSA